MLFMLLIAGDESASLRTLEAGCAKWVEAMETEGILVRQAVGLSPPAEAVSVRVEEGKALLSDGPFAETKDQIGGFCLVECSSAEDAIHAAATHPAAQSGVVEVRPLARPDSF